MMDVHGPAGAGADEPDSNSQDKSSLLDASAPGPASCTASSNPNPNPMPVFGENPTRTRAIARKNPRTKIIWIDCLLFPLIASTTTTTRKIKTKSKNERHHPRKTHPPRQIRLLPNTTNNKISQTC
ncbi:hypothetical protein BDQ17DRAFT_423194 [Cyathus striatus]|nr:hypothetical protein BDQ17DRAFT_423194 [Cyathus striatus]